MLYATNSPVFTSFLNKSSKRVNTTKGVSVGSKPELKAKGSDGKYQGE